MDITKAKLTGNWSILNDIGDSEDISRIHDNMTISPLNFLVKMITFKNISGDSFDDETCTVAKFKLI